MRAGRRWYPGRELNAQYRQIRGAQADRRFTPRRLVAAGTTTAPVCHDDRVPGMANTGNGCPLCEAQRERSGMAGDIGCPACQLVAEMTDRRPQAFE